MSVEDALAKLDAVKKPKMGSPRWEPPLEIAAKLLELHAAGLKAGPIAKALEGTEYEAYESTVRRWLQRNT